MSGAARAPLSLFLLLAAACASGQPRARPRAPAPPPGKADCDRAEGDRIARNRCLGFVLDQIVMSAVFRPYPDRRLAAYVTRVGRRVAAHAGRPDLAFRFRVLASPDPQGYALLGGFVYVTSGALARLGSEAELAALLAHEVAHVALDHGDDLLEIDSDAPLSDPGAVRRQLAHERDDEIQADERAVALLVAAGYHPSAMVTMLRRLDCAPDPVDLDPLDREHEVLARRLMRVARAIDGRTGGTHGAARYLAQLPHGILPAPAARRTIASSCAGHSQASPRPGSSPGREPPPPARTRSRPARSTSAAAAPTR